MLGPLSSSSLSSSSPACQFIEASGGLSFGAAPPSFHRSTREALKLQRRRARSQLTVARVFGTGTQGQRQGLGEGDIPLDVPLGSGESVKGVSGRGRGGGGGGQAGGVRGAVASASERVRGAARARSASDRAVENSERASSRRQEIQEVRDCGGI